MRYPLWAIAPLVCLEMSLVEFVRGMVSPKVHYATLLCPSQLLLFSTWKQYAVVFRVIDIIQAKEIAVTNENPHARSELEISIPVLLRY